MPRFALLSIVALAACHDGTPPPGPPIDPSAAAKFRGYAAVQADLYAKFAAPGSTFELSSYLGASGAELSKLVGRPDGFGVTFDVRNAQPNAMNVLVWRMMLRPFAQDLASKCPASHISLPKIQPIQLDASAAAVTSPLCAWPNVDDAQIGAAWDLVVGYLAPDSSRAAYIAFAHGLQSRAPDDALPDLWLAALLHPSFLLEQ